MNRKFFATVFIAIMAIVFLAGCAESSSSESAGSIDENGHITLEFWYPLGGTSGEVMEELIAQFNESQSEITVIGTYQGGYGATMAKIWNALSTETTPAIAHIGGAPLIGSTGSIVPISDYLDKSTDVNHEDIRAAFWDYNTAGGVIWSMPFNHSVPALFYNRDLFEAAGLDPDLPPTTWAEVIEYGQALSMDTDDNGVIDQWGFNTKQDTHWYLAAMFLQNGAEITNPEETEVLYNSPEAVEMLTMWGDFVNEYQIMPPGQHSEAKGDFLAGKLGMILMSSSNVPAVLEQAPFDAGIGMIPTVEGKNPISPIGGASLVIFRHDEEFQQAAWTFIEFLTSQESSIYLSINTGYLPIYKAASEWPELQEYYLNNPYREVPIMQLQYAQSIPIFSALGTSDAQLSGAVTAVELNASTPQEALDKAKNVVDKKIIENAEN